MKAIQILDKLNQFRNSEMEKGEAAKAAGINIASAVAETIGVETDLVLLGGVQLSRETAKSNLWLLPLSITIDRYIIKFSVEFWVQQDNVKLMLRNGSAKIDAYEHWDSNHIQDLNKFAKDVMDEFSDSLSNDQPNLYFLESNTTPFSVLTLPEPDANASVWVF